MGAENSFFPFIWEGQVAVPAAPAYSHACIHGIVHMLISGKVRIAEYKKSCKISDKEGYRGFKSHIEGLKNITGSLLKV